VDLKGIETPQEVFKKVLRSGLIDTKGLPLDALEKEGLAILAEVEEER